MTSYKLVMPEDMNHYGFLFGGKMLMWIEREVGYVLLSIPRISRGQSPR